MKALFVHDHMFMTDRYGKVYSAAAYPSYVWSRYLNHFDELTVLGRFSGVFDDPGKDNVVSSRNCVSFEFVESISNPLGLLLKSKMVKNKIYSLVNDADVVIVRLPSENGLIALKYARKNRKPHAIEVVGCVWDALWNHGSLLAKIYAPIAFYRMKKAIKKEKRVLYVTNYFLQKRYPASSDALSVSASNVELVIPEIVEGSKRKGKDKKIIFGLIGNYKTKYKGIHLAIKALGSLRDIIGDFEFRVLGKGDAEEYIALSRKYGIEDKVVFCGTLPNGEPVLNWLDEVDIYLQPSLQEGLPRALIEAMSRGCICVGSNAGGIPELLPSAFIHKAGSVNGLKKVIRETLEKKSAWIEDSVRNHEFSRKYNVCDISNTRFMFYQSLFCEAEKK